MDLSNIQPIYKKFENEQEAERFLAKLSVVGGKKIDVISIYPKGSYLHVWFYYDRTRLGYSKPEEAIKPIKKVSKKVAKKKID